MASLHVERLQSRQIANIVWSLGKCHRLLGARDHDSEARQLAVTLLRELERGNHRKLFQSDGASGARDAAQLLHGMARMRLARPATLRALATLLSDPRRPAETSQLALAAWGFGKLGWRDEKLLAALADRVVADRLYLRPWSMAALMRTYTLQRYRHAELAAAVAEVRAEGRGRVDGLSCLGARSGCCSGGVNQLQPDNTTPTQRRHTTPTRPQVALQQVKSFKPLELGSVAWALAAQPLAPEAAEKLRAAFGAAALVRLEAFGPVELGLLLEGLDGLGGVAPELLQAAAAGIGKEVEVVAGPADAGRILGAFVSARARGDSSSSSGGSSGPSDAAVAAMVDRLAAAAGRSVAAFTPPQVEAAAICFSRLPGGNMRRGAAAGSSSGSSSSSLDAPQPTRDSSSSGGSAVEAAAGERVQQLFRRLGHHAAARPELYGPRRLAQLIGCFAAADVVHDRLTDAAGERLVAECAAVAAATAGGGSEPQGSSSSANGGRRAPPTSPPQHVPNPGRDLEPLVDLAAQLAAVKRLRAPPAAALAAAAAPRLPDLKARKLPVLLAALAGRGELLADEAVRAALLAAADDVERRLGAAGGGLGGGGAAVPAGLAAAFGRALQHGLLAARGPQLVERLLGAVAAAAEAEGGAAEALSLQQAREVVGAMHAAGVEGPPGLRAAAEAVLAAAAEAGRGGPGNLMDAWEAL
jgi:hypothetical protein